MTRRLESANPVPPRLAPAFLALGTLLGGCQERAGAPDRPPPGHIGQAGDPAAAAGAGARAGSPAEPLAAEGSLPPVPPEYHQASELLLALLRLEWKEGVLPEGYQIVAVRPEPPSERTRQFQAVGKVSFDVRGRFPSCRISMTVYPTEALATEAFGVIGEPVAERNVLSREPIAAPGRPGPFWGERSTEEYDTRGKAAPRLLRVSVATVDRSAVVLAQILAPGEQSGELPTRAALSLLDGGVAHVRSARSMPPPPPVGVVAPAPLEPSSPPGPAGEEEPAPAPR